MHEEYAEWLMNRLTTLCSLHSRRKPVASTDYERCPIRMGTWGNVSQWCNRLLGIFGSCGRFCLGKGSVRKKVRPRGWPRRRRSRGEKGPDACIGYASTHKSI